jgi:hypothetical protein
VAEHVGAELSNGYFSVSPSGVLAYRAGASLTSGFQPTWFDQDGKVLGTFGQPGTDQNIVLSPDGNRAAGRNAAGASQGDIWLLDFMRGVRTRVTFRQSAGSPLSGRPIAFESFSRAEVFWTLSLRRR